MTIGNQSIYIETLSLLGCTRRISAPLDWWGGGLEPFLPWHSVFFRVPFDPAYPPTVLTLKTLPPPLSVFTMGCVVQQTCLLWDTADMSVV